MIFPVSGVEVSPIVPFAVALIVSFFTSMSGVSGAFLLLPFQVSFLNYTAPSVSATNQVFNIVAIPSGVYRYVLFYIGWRLFRDTITRTDKNKVKNASASVGASHTVHVTVIP